MREHVLIHTIYSSFIFRVLRLLLFFSLLTMIWLAVVAGTLPKLPLFFLSCLTMWEVFYHFSLSRHRPSKTVSDVSVDNCMHAVSHTGIDVLYAGHTTQNSLRRLLKLPQIRFLLFRMQLNENEIPRVQIERDAWAQQAYLLAKQYKAKYITSFDLFAAYLLLIESQEKVLFAKELKSDDLASLVRWGRMVFPDEENMIVESVEIAGGGLGDFLVFGWTPETEKYTTDFTYQALRESGNVEGREAEYQELLNGLAKPEARNVLIVGESGVGKERLVTAFAKDSFSGKLSGNVKHKRVMTLMIGSLLAGADNRAELEERLQTIIAELSHAGNIVLLIPELQEIMGDSSFNLNLSGALLPYLKGSSLPVIAMMSSENYKKYMEKSSLREVFSLIKLDEPDDQIAKDMIFRKVPDIERLYQALFPYRSIVTALTLSKNYLPDNVLPGSAVRLLSDTAQRGGTGASVRRKKIVLPEDVISLVEQTVRAPIAAPGKEEKELLLNMEERLHKRVIGQHQAISAVSEAMRRLRSGVTKHSRPVSFLFLGPTGVGKTETAKALAELYYGGEEKIIRLDMSEYVDGTSVERLLGAAPGFGDERGELTDMIHDNPYTLVLLDEFEKAHPKILDLFLQVLSDGRLTDNKGKTVSFSNAIIIATSNAGSAFIREKLKQGNTVDKAFQTEFLDVLQSQNLFKPELLNRFDGIITFTPLSPDEVQSVVTLLLGEVRKQLAEQDITVAFDDAVVPAISRQGYDEQFGARPLRRYIQDTIEEKLAKLKLEEKVDRGDTVMFTVSEDGTITATVKKDTSL